MPGWLQIVLFALIVAGGVYVLVRLFLGNEGTGPSGRMPNTGTGYQPKPGKQPPAYKPPPTDGGVNPQNPL